MLPRQGMSKYAYGALRDIAREPIPWDDCGHYNDTTLNPLFERHEIEVVRRNGGNYIALTKKGVAAMSEYTQAHIPERKNPGPVTRRTAAYLRMIRLRRAS